MRSLKNSEGLQLKLLKYYNVLDKKMNYIHYNPVRAEVVANPIEYL